MTLSAIRISIAGALLAAALSGCIVAPAPGVVTYAPPAPQAEVIGVAPAPGYFWIGGGYFWEGGRYAWHPGYWSAPRYGYRWAPHGWVRSGGGWREVPGRWVRR